MKIKMFALILALVATMWAQTANPPASDKDAAAAPASAAACPCCDKMAKGSKDMPCCQGKEAKGEMACCYGKDSKGELACCNGKDANACMRASKDAGNCCGKNAACCKEGASCCAKDKKEIAAKGCCAGDKCDRHAHQHASGM